MNLSRTPDRPASGFNFDVSPVAIQPSPKAARHRSRGQMMVNKAAQIGGPTAQATPERVRLFPQRPIADNLVSGLKRSSGADEGNDYDSAMRKGRVPVRSSDPPLHLGRSAGQSSSIIKSPGLIRLPAVPNFQGSTSNRQPLQRQQQNNGDAEARRDWTSRRFSSPLVSSSRGELQGFRNLGNSCYMNAILQALLSIPVFTRGLLVSRDWVPKGSLCWELARLVETTSSKRRGVLDVKVIQECVGKRYPQFASNQQQDAHEFLSTALMVVEDDVLVGLDLPKIPENPLATRLKQIAAARVAAAKKVSLPKADPEVTEEEGAGGLTPEFRRIGDSPPRSEQLSGRKRRRRRGLILDLEDDEGEGAAQVPAATVTAATQDPVVPDSPSSSPSSSPPSTTERAQKRQRTIEPAGAAAASGLDSGAGSELMGLLELPSPKPRQLEGKSEAARIWVPAPGDSFSSAPDVDTAETKSDDGQDAILLVDTDVEDADSAEGSRTAGCENTSGGDDQPQHELTEEEREALEAWERERDRLAEEIRRREHLRLQEHSPALLSFGSVAQVQLTCAQCGFRRTNNEAFQHLSLNLTAEDEGGNDEAINSPGRGAAEAAKTSAAASSSPSSSSASAVSFEDSPEKPETSSSQTVTERLVAKCSFHNCLFTCRPANAERPAVVGCPVEDCPLRDIADAGDLAAARVRAIQQTAEPSFNSRSANVEAPAEDQEESRDCKARPAAAEAKPEASMHGRQHRRKRKSKRLGIRSLLRRFFDPQKLELRCERCSGNQVRVETRLQRLPRVLVLHLKRFWPNFKRGTYEKSQVPVWITDRLSLDFCATPDSQLQPSDMALTVAKLLREAREGPEIVEIRSSSDDEDESPAVMSRPAARRDKRKEAAVDLELEEGKWSCPVCTFENHGLITECEMCGKANGKKTNRHRLPDPLSSNTSPVSSFSLSSASDQESDDQPKVRRPPIGQLLGHSPRPKAQANASRRPPLQLKQADNTPVKRKVEKKTKLESLVPHRSMLASAHRDRWDPASPQRGNSLTASMVNTADSHITFGNNKFNSYDRAPDTPPLPEQDTQAFTAAGLEDIGDDSENAEHCPKKRFQSDSEHMTDDDSSLNEISESDTPDGPAALPFVPQMSARPQTDSVIFSHRHVALDSADYEDADDEDEDEDDDEDDVRGEWKEMRKNPKLRLHVPPKLIHKKKQQKDASGSPRQTLLVDLATASGRPKPEPAADADDDFAEQLRKAREASLREEHERKKRDEEDFQRQLKQIEKMEGRKGVDSDGLDDLELDLTGADPPPRPLASSLVASSKAASETMPSSIRFSGTEEEDSSSGDESDPWVAPADETDPEHAARRYRYRLRAITHHLGSRPSSGHYITDICWESKRAGEDGVDDSGKEWKRYDDQYVRKIKEAESLGNNSRRTCYVLFYVLEDGVPSDEP